LAVIYRIYWLKKIYIFNYRDETMKKICVVVGTRPEAIKMAPVILELRKNSSNFDVTVCSTGQHATMLDSALASFGLRADIGISVMKPGQTLAELTSNILLGLSSRFKEMTPDLVLVHGDTASAMAGALAAFYNQIEVGHVEAGLRTGDLLSPFPEEYNRRSVSIATKYHFAPTPSAKDNLVNEGVDQSQIILTGNTVIDALLLTISDLKENPDKISRVRANLSSSLGFIPDEKRFILITAHRRENFGAGMDNICHSICSLAKANPELHFVYPVHLNPIVKNVVDLMLGGVTNVSLIPPQDYLHFAWLMHHCVLVLTDSGGIQEEAPALGKPVLVMRDTSERPEAILAGTAKLVTTDPETIIRETQILISDHDAYLKMARASNPFGDGLAAKRISEYLISL